MYICNAKFDIHVYNYIITFRKRCTVAEKYSERYHIE